MLLIGSGPSAAATSVLCTRTQRQVETPASLSQRGSAHPTAAAAAAATAAAAAASAGAERVAPTSQVLGPFIKAAAPGSQVSS